MNVKKEYREKDMIGAFGLIIEVRGNPKWVEIIVDVIDEGFSNRKMGESLEEI